MDEITWTTLLGETGVVARVIGRESGEHREISFAAGSRPGRFTLTCDGSRVAFHAARRDGGFQVDVSRDGERTRLWGVAAAGGYVTRAALIVDCGAEPPSFGLFPSPGGRLRAACMVFTISHELQHELLAIVDMGLGAFRRSQAHAR